MLPAPGAYMLQSGQITHSKENRQPVGSGSILEDPIITTAWQSKKRNSKGALNRRKGGSKTWTTLNLQQASSGNPAAKQQGLLPLGKGLPLRAQNPELPPVQVTVPQQHSSIWSDADDIDIDPTPDKPPLDTGRQSVDSLKTIAADALAIHSHPSAALHIQPNCTVTDAGNEGAEPALAQWSEQQARLPRHSAPAPLEGSETQPELPIQAGNVQHLMQTACPHTHAGHQGAEPALFQQIALASPREEGVETQPDLSMHANNAQQTPLLQQPTQCADTPMQSQLMQQQLPQHCAQCSDTPMQSQHMQAQQVLLPQQSAQAADRPRQCQNMQAQQALHPQLFAHCVATPRQSQHMQAQETCMPSAELQNQASGLVLHDSDCMQLTGSKSDQQSGADTKLGMPEGPAGSATESGNGQQGLHIQTDRPVQVLMSLGR